MLDAFIRFFMLVAFCTGGESADFVLSVTVGLLYYRSASRVVNNILL